MPIAKLAVLAAVLFASAASGSAQESKPPLPDHFPVGKEACFGRVYGDMHLNLRPKQSVASLHIFRDLDPDQNTEEEPLTREEILRRDGESGSVNVSAFVRFRNRKGLFWNTLNCSRSADGHVTRCGIDCDGGSFDLQPRQQSLLLTNNGFVLIGGCGASEEESENPVFFSPGADDRVFRLEPLPLVQCAALREAVKPSFAKMGKALRVRFATEDAVCYLRAYDDAHLKKHPQQTVRRIALLKAAGGRRQGRTQGCARLRSDVQSRNQGRQEIHADREVLSGSLCLYLSGKGRARHRKEFLHRPIGRQCADDPRSGRQAFGVLRREARQRRPDL